jgi:hypothetical protein
MAFAYRRDESSLAINNIPVIAVGDWVKLVGLAPS